MPYYVLIFLGFCLLASMLFGIILLINKFFYGSSGLTISNRMSPEYFRKKYYGKFKGFNFKIINKDIYYFIGKYNNFDVIIYQRDFNFVPSLMPGRTADCLVLIIFFSRVESGLLKNKTKEFSINYKKSILLDEKIIATNFFFEIEIPIILPDAKVLFNKIKNITDVFKKIGFNPVDKNLIEAVIQKINSDKFALSNSLAETYETRKEIDYYFI